MSANFTPSRGAYTELKPFRFWCQKVLPLVYDDSLSYYELLCKVVDYLNKTMEDVETLEGDVTSMYTAYEQLQGYVNNYFDQNFPQLVSDKLDEMAEDGTLTALITPVVTDTIDEQLPGEVAEKIGDTVAGQIGPVVSNQIGPVVSNQIGPVVADWLEDNMSATTPAVDRTLSILNAAADAAFTGTRLDNLDDAVGYEHISDTGAIITTAEPYAFNYNYINYNAAFSDNQSHTYKMLVIPVTTGDKYRINAHKISIANVTADHFAVTYAFCAKYVGDPNTDIPYYLPTTYNTDAVVDDIVTVPEINIPTGQFYDETTGYLVVITADIQDPVYKIADALVKESDIADIRSDLTSAQEDITATQGDITQIRTDLTAAQGNITQIRTDLTVAQEDITAAQGDITDINNALETKADVDGTYPLMTVGTAQAIKGNEDVIDSKPYLYRKTGANAIKEYDEIVGGSVIVNQRITPTALHESGTNSGVTYTNNGDGSITLNGTASGSFSYLFYGGMPRLENHKYLILGYKKIGSNTGYLGYNGVNVDSGNGGIFNAPNSSVNIRLDVRNGDSFSNTTMKPIVVDLTQMFGSAIADYAYTLEQATAGSGVAWLKSYGFFADDYIPYNTGMLAHVSGLTAHIMRDADDNIIGNYPLDSTLILRGIPKLSNDQMYYDGDVYSADGTVTRNYGIRTYQSGDESLTDAITDGTNTVYKLTTPTTETATAYQTPQICDANGTEEYVTSSIPVGHNTIYPVNLVSKLEGLPWNFSNLIAPTEGNTASTNYSIGDYLIKDNVLYKVTAAIASGAAITPGTNVAATTVMAEIKALQ